MVKRTLDDSDDEEAQRFRKKVKSARKQQRDENVKNSSKLSIDDDVEEYDVVPSDVDDQLSPTMETGIIVKIEMQNFMCHRKFTINLGRKVNFITGQNGSGTDAAILI